MTRKKKSPAWAGLFRSMRETSVLAADLLTTRAGRAIERIERRPEHVRQIDAMLTGMVQGTIFGETDVLYELDKFIYLGSHARYAPYAFLTRKAAGFNSAEKFTASRGVRIGAPSVGHSLYTIARLFTYILDKK